MNPLKPIFTAETECQDCYKCVRECPVKAIQIKDNVAGVVEDLCVLCGHCVNVCPMQAKKIRTDLERAKQLLKRKENVVVSLAPSFVSEFPGVTESQFIFALKQLGFAAVSETALGAEIVSSHVAEAIEAKGPGIYLSSACPVVVEYIRKYRPEYVNKITRFFSPVLAHCQMLKKEFGDDCSVVFISPCIGKKNEADTHPELLDIALTFADLRDWLNEEGIDLTSLETGDAEFIPRKAHEGALYPVDGGMIAGVKAVMPNHENVFFMAVSGMKAIGHSITDIDGLENEVPVFLEFLACEGGCINGPAVEKRSATGLKRFKVIKNANYHNEKKQRIVNDVIEMKIDVNDKRPKKFTDQEVREVLNSLGKLRDKDELNCSGCGYDSCRDLAAAYLDNRAEKTMCVSYMRKLAQKKASALLSAMPSGVVIVDSNKEIVECNRNFAQLMGEEVLSIYDYTGGLEQAKLNQVIPFHHLFSRVLKDGENIINREHRVGNSIYLISIFSIESKTLVGGVIQDITQPAIQKDHIVKKAQEVIQKNLSTVQQIAYLLGENAADSEVLLNSIIKSFTLEKTDEVNDPSS